MKLSSLIDAAWVPAARSPRRLVPARGRLRAVGLIVSLPVLLSLPAATLDLARPAVAGPRADDPAVMATRTEPGRDREATDGPDTPSAARTSRTGDASGETTGGDPGTRGPAPPADTGDAPPEATGDGPDGRRNRDVTRIPLPFAASPEIRKYAREAIRGVFTTPEKVRRLREAILDRKQLALEYDPYATYSAEETFRNGVGNCMAFTNLFIAMARSVDVDAFYVEVTDVDEFYRKGDLVVNNRHICAGFWSWSGIGIIDFIDVEPTLPTYRPISDELATAQYYNNRGFDRLRADDLEGAEKMFRTALSLRADFAWGHNNLGVVLGRLGRHEEAEQEYRLAIEDDPKYSPPYSNLAAAYVQQGRIEEAEAVFDQLAKVRSRDPYSHYQAGMLSLRLRDYEKALKRFRKSAALDPTMPEAQLGIGQACVGLGRREDARRAFERVLELDPGNPAAQAGLDHLDS